MRITLKPIIVIQLKLAKTILVIGLLVKLLKSVTDVAGHVTSFDKKRKTKQNMEQKILIVAPTFLRKIS